VACNQEWCSQPRRFPVTKSISFMLLRYISTSVVRLSINMSYLYNYVIVFSDTFRYFRSNIPLTKMAIVRVKVTLRSICVVTDAVRKQWVFHILSVCVWAVRLHHICPHNLINDTIFLKMLLDIKCVFLSSFQMCLKHFYSNNNAARCCHKFWFLHCALSIM
jgi:hypothetical protein